MSNPIHSQLSFISTNAVTQMEQAVALKAAEFILSRKFPVERIALSILFKDTMRDHSDISIKVQDDAMDADFEGPLEGEAAIKFNSLFLVQDPQAFIEHVITHEVAHLFNDLTAISKQEKVKKHGSEWQDWLAMLDPDDYLVASRVESFAFDSRACVARAGGCIASCSCPDVEYSVFSLRSEEYREYQNGSLHCGVCDSGYALIPPGETKGKFREELDYLHSITGKRKDRVLSELIPEVSE